MYREPPSTCAVCGDAVDPHDTDVIESGLRCRRCTDAADLASLEPVLAEVREAQAAWRALGPAAAHARSEPERGCSRHAQWDTHCFWCVLRSWLPDDDP